MKPAATALMIVDVQVGMFESPLIPPVCGGTSLLATLKGLIARARSASIPIVYVQHLGAKGHPLEEGSPMCAVHPAIGPQPGDALVQKRFCDSFHKTHLHELLQSKSIRNLVIAGIQSEFCVDTACRRAFSLGYDVTLVEDGHRTWDSKVIKADQIIAHHNLTLSSSFVRLEKAEAVFPNSSSPAVAS